MTTFTVAQKIAIWFLPVLFAITVHEVAHGWVASLFGDKTAKLAGRLTLNPIKHIDLFGTIIVPLLLLLFGNFIFGWAKPVPVDARNLHHPRFNMAIVACAGPLSNLLMALLWAFIAKFGLSLMHSSTWFGEPLFYMGQAGIVINVLLGLLNCLPIPPLDGGRVVINLLPKKIGWAFSRFEPFGFLILILLIMTGALSYVLEPAILATFQWISSLFSISMTGI